ncbi:hypothetical protein F5Y19DRAFT_237426 [Xylariaceae sp. FL1651]|nr:hypothetical protein F5Y19DRAFT_237426 [Xylariaceae sp. FL1651]
MRSSFSIIAFAGIATAIPRIPFVTNTNVIPIKNTPPVVSTRQSQPCFIVGSKTLPQETADAADALANTVTCSSSVKTISGVPDVTSGSTSFSSIDFSQSSQTPLQFALSKFATEEPLADSNLSFFQDALNAYVATEAGIRSVGGSLAIKVPKFFLEMQVSRIQTAQGNPPTDAGLQVDHLKGKVLSNAAGEDQTLLDQVTELATQLR